MKKLTWILTAVIVVLAILCANLWQRNTVEENDLEVMCKSSVTAALGHFEEYNTTGDEEDYIAGVAEFRAYMTTYLCLVNEASSAEYLWCNTLYGKMTLNPDGVKEHTDELVEALEYLVEDYQHPNGFNLINTLNNEIG